MSTAPVAAPAAGPAPSPRATPEGERPLGWTPADTVRTVIALTVAVALLATAGWLGSVRGDGVGGSAASFALLAGTGLGILFERGRFCFFCIFRDAFEKKNTRGVYSILTAIGVGTVGYALVFSIRLPDPTSGTLPSGAHIAPVSIALVVAGLVFGAGVVISGGCIAGHLYRLGEGSLRSIPALLGALIGFGLGFLTWNPIYSHVVVGAPVPWLPAGAGYGIAVALQLGVLAAVAVALLRWNPPIAARPRRTLDADTLRRLVFFKRWPALATGAGVGVIGFLAFLRDRPLGVTSQLSSLTRTTMDSVDALPHTLLGLDVSLGGCVALVVDTITSNGWLVIGIVAGSFAAALPGRRFSIEPLTLRGSGTGLLGGVLIGWASIIGLGCTIGVFLSGTQALAVSGWVFAGAVVLALGVGFRLGLHRGT
ncbi:YeeE/YedE family protein [Georgenia sp. Z1491]|uniref:YeeE/YedE family protein n=1 Tax=Georgenia sp. Z1491 TaxID=3416707 RepID=UPI003CF316A4